MKPDESENHVFAVSPEEEERAIRLEVAHCLDALPGGREFVVLEVHLCNSIFVRHVFCEIIAKSSGYADNTRSSSEL